METKEKEIVEKIVRAIRNNDVELLMDMSDVLKMLAQLNSKLYRIDEELTNTQ